jgi:hypothetical protein
MLLADGRLWAMVLQGFTKLHHSRSRAEGHHAVID